MEEVRQRNYQHIRWQLAPLSHFNNSGRLVMKLLLNYLPSALSLLHARTQSRPNLGSYAHFQSPTTCIYVRTHMFVYAIMTTPVFSSVSLLLCPQVRIYIWINASTVLSIVAVVHPHFNLNVSSLQNVFTSDFSPAWPPLYPCVYLSVRRETYTHVLQRNITTPHPVTITISSKVYFSFPPTSLTMNWCTFDLLKYLSMTWKATP